MQAQITATVIDGGLELDHPLELPDSTRVLITFSSVSATPPAIRGETGWSAMKRRIQERPVHVAGLHFSREELHERR